MEKNIGNEQHTIVVFGANGGIGKCCVEQALEAGYNVTAIMRKPSNIAFTHPRLKVVKGDVTDMESFDDYLKGAFAVVSAIGVPANRMSKSSPPITLYSQGNLNILRAMEKHGITRVFAISASAVEISPMNSFIVRFATKLIVQRMFGRSYEDQLVMETIFKHSNTNWTVIRPPRLIDKKVTGKYRYAINSFLKNCLSISRADVAHFIVAHMNDTATYKSIIEIAY